VESSVLAYIREVIDDTSGAIFSDSFIESISTSKDNNTEKTISELFLILASKVISSSVSSYSIGNESYSLYDAYKRYLELAEIWNKKSSSMNAGALFENNINKDTNEEAEQQSSYRNLMGDAYSAE